MCFPSIFFGCFSLGQAGSCHPPACPGSHHGSPPKINYQGWVTPNPPSLFLSCFPAQDEGTALSGANPQGSHIPKWEDIPIFWGGTPQYWGEHPRFEGSVLAGSAHAWPSCPGAAGCSVWWILPLILCGKQGRFLNFRAIFHRLWCWVLAEEEEEESVDGAVWWCN